MRQHAGRVNRGWLVVLGLVLMIAAALGVLLATGRFAEAGRDVGLDLPPVAGTDPVLSGLDATSTVVAVGFAVAGIVLAVLGLLWLIAQLPRKNEAAPYRFDSDAGAGVTTCPPRVLCGAVQTAAAEIDDVNSAAAVLRGSGNAPELTLKLMISDQADVGQVMDEVRRRVATDLSRSLGTPLALLAVSLDVEHAHRSAGRVLL